MNLHITIIKYDIGLLSDRWWQAACWKDSDLRCREPAGGVLAWQVLAIRLIDNTSPSVSAHHSAPAVASSSHRSSADSLALPVQNKN